MILLTLYIFHCVCDFWKISVGGGGVAWKFWSTWGWSFRGAPKSRGAEFSDEFLRM